MTCGYHEILLHDIGEEELPFVSLSELDYLRRIWPRAVFAFMTRYQQDLECKRKAFIQSRRFASMSQIPAQQSYRKSCGFSGHVLKASATLIDESDSAVGCRLHRQLAQDLAAQVVKSTDTPAGGHIRSLPGHRIMSRPRRSCKFGRRAGVY